MITKPVFVDILLPNEKEILNLSQKNNLEAAIEEIKPYTNILALKLGGNGGRVLRGAEDISIRPYLNKTYIDAIGAGDSFNAGFLKKFLDEVSLEECLDYANLIGSLSTTAAGGTMAFTNTNEINSKIEQIRNNEL